MVKGVGGAQHWGREGEGESLFALEPGHPRFSEQAEVNHVGGCLWFPTPGPGTPLLPPRQPPLQGDFHH